MVVWRGPRAGAAPPRSTRMRRTPAPGHDTRHKAHGRNGPRSPASTPPRRLEGQRQQHKPVLQHRQRHQRPEQSEANRPEGIGTRRGRLAEQQGTGDRRAGHRKGGNNAFAGGRRKKLHRCRRWSGRSASARLRTPRNTLSWRSAARSAGRGRRPSRLGSDRPRSGRAASAAPARIAASCHRTALDVAARGCLPPGRLARAG